MKERGALQAPGSKVDLYPKGTEKIVDSLVRNGWQRKAMQATFMTFMDGYPFTAKGVRWSLGKASNILPPAVSTSGMSAGEIDLARERQAEELMEGVIRSRHPKQIALRKTVRRQGVDPAVVAYDLALAISGDVPPVEVERYEPTTDETVLEEAPWLLRFAGHPDLLEEWHRDPQKVSREIQDLYRRLGDPSLGDRLDDALQHATEEQMATARAEVREMLGALPHMAGADSVFGIAGAFIMALARQVGTVDWEWESSSGPDQTD